MDQPGGGDQPSSLETQDLAQTTGDQKFPIRGSWTLPAEQQGAEQEKAMAAGSC